MTASASVVEKRLERLEREVAELVELVRDLLDCVDRLEPRPKLELVGSNSSAKYRRRR